MRIQKESVSMEAIAHQGHSKLYADLIVACGKLKEEVVVKGFKTNGGEPLLEIQKVILKHTNIDVMMKLSNSFEHNAWTYLADFGLNHPFLKWVHDISKIKEGANDDTGAVINQLLKFSKESEGWVDRKQSKVFGIYKELTFTIGLTRGLVKNETPEEIASSVLHELGHDFTQLEFLTGVLTRNYILGTISQSINGIDNKIEKVKLLDKVKTDMDLTTLDTTEASLAKNNDILSIYLVNSSLKSFYTDSGNYSYDVTGCESLADQFVVRHGGGVAFVQSLDKMQRGDEATYGTWSRFFLVLLEIVGNMYLAYLPLIICLLTELMCPYRMDRYDTPRYRAKRIRDQVIDALKDPDITTAEKTRLAKDVRLIEKSMALYRDYESLTTKIINFVLPSRQRDKDNKAFQQVIEDLAYPRLLTTAAEYELRG